MIKQILTFIVAASMLGLAGVARGADAQGAKVPRVVYHISDAEHQALGGLRNIRNHLDVAPNTKIVVVSNAKGVDFMMSNYKDAAKVDPLISALAARGVDFEVCEVTMKNRKLKKDDFVMEANFTPSGVVRITQLENEGYAYIKP
ncbi:DsrE family protein [Candidimonas humi]|uniref:DsrE family protein n=1 Tax=Candidimonas humi TaxID=683355 RepID=A0ABV8NV91_9BURK|nr:DsrE family protein [Candidimonas humi]MBV6304667.1 DsrE family protein [Candidimonas humi]